MAEPPFGIARSAPPHPAVDRFLRRTLAMVLAGIGVYGVFTYWVSQRRKEMAIRLALGSSRPELLRLTVSQAMRLILAGGVIGIAGAWFLDRLLASMLVGVDKGA